MPKWGRVVLRTVGVINAAAVALGGYCMISPFYPVLTGRLTAPDVAPYLRSTYGAMLLINVFFLVVLLVTAIRFIQTRLSSVNLYSLTVLLLVVYCVGLHMLWRAGRGIGLSVAAATGIGNMGIAPFVFVFVEPLIYPIASVVLVQVLKQRCSTAPIPAAI